MNDLICTGSAVIWIPLTRYFPVTGSVTAARPEMAPLPAVQEAAVVPEPIVAAEPAAEPIEEEPVLAQAPPPEPAPAMEPVGEIPAAREPAASASEVQAEIAAEPYAAPVSVAVEPPHPAPLAEPPMAEPQEVRPIPEEEKRRRNIFFSRRAWNPKSISASSLTWV